MTEYQAHTPVLKTGYPAVNRLLEPAEGFQRGDMVVIGGLPNHYKSRFALNLFRQIALYNEPVLFDPKKKPLLIHLSLENTLFTNMGTVYTNLMENETEKPCVQIPSDFEKLSEHVKEKLSVNGYYIDMLRLNPEPFHIDTLKHLLSEYDAQGYEIHAVVCDFLNLVNKEGLGTEDSDETGVLELFRRVRQFCAPRGITFITPHQLNRKPKIIVDSDPEMFVMYDYDGSKRIGREVDVEFLLHLIRHEENKHLLLHRVKHRGDLFEANERLECVLPFNGFNSPLDGVNEILREKTSAQMLFEKHKSVKHPSTDEQESARLLSRKHMGIG